MKLFSIIIHKSTTITVSMKLYNDILYEILTYIKLVSTVLVVFILKIKSYEVK